VAELWEEVNRAWAVAIMAEAHAAQAEGMAQERVVILDTIRSEADNAS
jgi:hypothetical protein